MTVLVVQMFFLLLFAATIGLIAGRWWQRGIAIKREKELKLRLKARNRFSQRLDTDLDSTTQGQATGGQTTSKVRTIASTLDENEKLKFQIAEQQTESAKLHTDLTSATLELEQERQNSTNVRVEMEHWQNSFTQLQTQQSQLEAAKLSMDQQVADYAQQQTDLQLAADARDQALADKQTLQDQINQNDAQLAQLTQAQEASTAAQQENSRLSSICADLRKNCDALKDEKQNIESKLATVTAQAEKLEGDLTTSNETAKNLDSKLLERRALLGKLKIDLAKAQRSLRDSQQQSQKFQAERDALNLRRAKIDEILNASILKPMPEPNTLQSSNSELKPKPPAKAGTASRSLPHRIKALETIVRNQRTKIEVLRDVVEDMQNVLHLDSPQSMRAPHEVSSSAANDSNKITRLSLIKRTR